LDVLVNNAGVSMIAPFEEVRDWDAVETLIRVNYLGSVYCTHYALPSLKAARGRIVVVSSLAGRMGTPTRTCYSASKHAMTGFFDALRIELAGSGVTVTTAFPDFVASEIRQRAFGPDGKPGPSTPVREGDIMTAETCARLILDAAARRKRELIMSVRGRLGLALRPFFPALVDRFLQRAVEGGR
ncbi:MAG TPA: SDR family oxidoreductase, partial [Planctomycetaceae bacterium]|nr:SDR family oxidoreductase [Planctomycetaceae bacterium]